MTLREIFDQASGMDDDERRTFLEQTCGGAEATKVARMLELFDANDDFMKTPVLDQATRDAVLEGMQEPMPERIGRFTVIGPIASGGMGVVYEAEQQAPARRVAVKLIHAGLVNRKALDRFDLEAEALGRLHHPGVAQIFEAGVAEVDGRLRPFIAMELIDGVHIDEHAKSLSPNERLELIARVADALHHAHLRGVIHRDLKPGNVLVDREGRPCIVDFGVACLAERDAALTMTGPIGTLGAMSPEQIAGGEIDARSDVYAIGALAYHLLADRPALDLSGLGLVEAAQVIREREPAGLDAALHADVDTIVARAMAKDPDRRYASAAAFAEDIRRFLDRRPIEARPPSLRYQLGRWAARRRALAAGLGAGLAAMLIAAAGVSAALVWALNEQQQAEARAADAEASIAFLQDMLTGAQPAAMGRDARVVDVLDQAVESLGDLEGQPLLEARLRHMAAETYQALGEYSVSEPHLRRALELRIDVGSGADVAETSHALGFTLVKLGRYDEAEPLIRDAVDARRELHGEHDERTLASMHAACLLMELDGRYQEALPETEALHASTMQSLGADHELTMTAANCLANLQLRVGAVDDARALHVETLERRTRVLGRTHPDTLQSMSNLGGVCLETGDLDEARALLDEAADLSVRVRGPRHPETLTTQANLAVALRRQGRLDDARSLLQNVLDARRRVLGDAHSETIISMGNLASIHLQMGELDVALLALDEAVEQSRIGGLEQHPTTGRLLLMRADLLARLERTDDAEQSLQEAEVILVSALGEEGRAMCRRVRDRWSE